MRVFKNCVAISGALAVCVFYSAAPAMALDHGNACEILVPSECASGAWQGVYSSESQCEASVLSECGTGKGGGKPPTAPTAPIYNCGIGDCGYPDDGF